MELLTKLLNFADEFDMLPKSGTILVCVSGGADSMCLLDILIKVSVKRGFTIEVAHYNHKLRGAESDRDELFVKDYCKKRVVPLYSESGDVKEYAKENKVGIEEAARDLRYNFFYKTAEQTGALRIATAHNADDNAETMIMNLVRGTGVLGLSGIPPKRGMIVRPILCASRDEIIDYVKENAIPYVEDSTNSLNIYTRNKIRHEVMPVLKEINPRIAEASLSTSAILRSDEEFLAQTANRFIEEQCTGNTALVNDILQLPSAISTRVIRKLYGGSLSSKHVKSVLELCENDSPSASISLPGMIVQREYGKIIFGISEAVSFAPIEPVDGAMVTIPGLEINMTCKLVVYDGKINKSLTSFLFKNSDVCGKMTVRARLQGDTIKLLGHSGTKSLKKLFIERRIPRGRRELVPVIADDIGVLAVYGIGVGERAVPTLGDLALHIDFGTDAIQTLKDGES